MEANHAGDGDRADLAGPVVATRTGNDRLVIVPSGCVLRPDSRFVHLPKETYQRSVILLPRARALSYDR